eukprot:3192444-Rhodomonas_salina.2
MHYAVCGTEIAYGATRSGPYSRVPDREELAYAARLRRVRYCHSVWCYACAQLCTVLTWRMLLREMRC